MGTPDPADDDSAARAREFALWRRAAIAARQYTVSFMGDNPADPRGSDFGHVGSGVVVQVGTDIFAFTAAHVVDAIREEQESGRTLHFCVGRQMVPLDEAHAYCTGVGTPRTLENDPSDAAVVRFHARQVVDAELPAHALPLSRVSPDPNRENLNPWQVYGLPAAKLFIGEDSTREGDTFIQAFHVAGNLEPATPPHDPRIHLRFSVDDMRTEHGTPCPPWRPGGMSGCGMWGLCADRARIEEWRPEQMRLGGICHRAIPRGGGQPSVYEALIGTRPMEHLRLIHQRIPECRPALRAAFPDIT